MATLTQRRKANRDRRARWVERQRVKGKKIVSAVLSRNAQDVLNSEKEKTGENNSAVIERALLNLTKSDQKKAWKLLKGIDL
ncbi:hypothetical protein ACFL03_06095 [Thermodesulfobacteriota bacterium]